LERLKENAAALVDQHNVWSAGWSAFRGVPFSRNILAENLGSFAPSDVLITVRNHRLRQDFHLYAQSRYLEASTYFQGIVSGGFQENQGVQDWGEAFGSPQEDDDSDDELDAELQTQGVATVRLPSEVMNACRPKVCHIKTSAHRFSTWRMVIHCCQTGQQVLRFRRLRSLGGSHPTCDIEASPKSVYKLAKYLGLSTLAKAALDNLITQLTPAIAEAELFSSFCLDHIEVRSLICPRDEVLTPYQAREAILDYCSANHAAIQAARKRKAAEPSDDQVCKRANTAA
jgi:hypothetical protein